MAPRISSTLAEILWSVTPNNPLLVNLATEENRPLSAFVWWLIPLFAFIGSIGYVIWVSKFKSRYENQTNRSVLKFQKFQSSFDDKGR
jgi:hypothetical protein